MIVAVELDTATAAALEAAAGRAGQTPSAFLADQVALSFGPGRTAIDVPIRQSRAQRRIMTERARATRAAVRALRNPDPNV